jgi:hypothetical protein
MLAAQGGTLRSSVMELWLNADSGVSRSTLVYVRSRHPYTPEDPTSRLRVASTALSAAVDQEHDPTTTLTF